MMAFLTRKRIGLMAGALLLLVLGITLIAIFLPAGVDETLPNPNGYALLVQASSLVNTPGQGFGTTNLAELGALVATNELPLRLTRDALKMQIVVTGWSVNNLPQIRNLKTLGLLLRADGQFLEAQSNYVGAAESYCHMVQLGQGVARGLLIHQLIGLSVERMGLTALEKLSPKLSAHSLQHVSSNLLAWDEQREPFLQVKTRERAFMRMALRSVPLKEVILFPIAVWRGRATRAGVEQKRLGVQLDNRKLALDLATRAYEIESGKKPSKAEDLVPKYLPRLPLDLVSGQPLQVPKEEGQR